MKITWKFNDGTSSEVEVADDVGTFILDSRRKERALAERERYHCPYSYDAILYEGEEYAAPETPASTYEKAERNKLLHTSMETLTETQRRRLLMFADGLSYREIARREGVSDHKKVIKSINAAREKIKKFF